MSKAPTQRMLRVGELVRHALAELFVRGEIIDPIIENSFFSVGEVRMSADLKLASIYVSALGDDNVEQIVAALNKHKKFIRGAITPKLQLKFSPQIRFFIDNSLNEAVRIEELLHSKRVMRDLEK